MEELLRNASTKNIIVVRELAHHLRWKASKLAPRSYGDRLSAEVSGPDGAPFKLSAMDWDGLIKRATDTEPGSPQEAEPAGRIEHEGRVRTVSVRGS